MTKRKAKEQDMRTWATFLLLSALPFSSPISSAYGAIIATTPPRGWNSYDSYSWIITEEQFLQNAQLVSQLLLDHGYEYVVVGYLWHRKADLGVATTSGHDVIDNWGRPIPDPVRWPSSANGKGFGPIADRVHALGLKFGIHVMHGVSFTSISKNSPIKGSPLRSGGRPWRIRDITIREKSCSSMSDSFSGINVNSAGGQAYIKSLYDQYANWGVDFIKHDCVFGDDLHLDDIMAVSKAISSTGHPMVYSISPGLKATTVMGMRVANVTQMYRITSNTWDVWSDVHSHFNVAREFSIAGLIGGQSMLVQQSWPDLDMLPFGWITDPGGTYHKMNLWAMVKSPLFFGGDMQKLDQFTLELLSNPFILEINAFSSGNKEHVITPSTHNSLKLVDCGFSNDTIWTLSAEDTDPGNRTRLCWKKTGESECFHWTPSSTTSRLNFEESLGGERLEHVHGHVKINMSVTNCLDADNFFEHSLHTQMTGQYGFTSCSGKLSQEWVLRSGMLVSKRFGTCATVMRSSSTTVSLNDSSRIWLAQGRSGQIYVALFNIGERKMKVSIAIDEMMRSLQRPKSRTIVRASSWRCVGFDLWQQKSIGVLQSSLTRDLGAHQSALFLMDCNFSLENSQEYSVLTKVVIALFVIIIAFLVGMTLAKYYMECRQRKS